MWMGYSRLMFNPWLERRTSRIACHWQFCLVLKHMCLLKTEFWTRSSQVCCKCLGVERIGMLEIMENTHPVCTTLSKNCKFSWLVWNCLHLCSNNLMCYVENRDDSSHIVEPKAPCDVQFNDCNVGSPKYDKRSKVTSKFQFVWKKPNMRLPVRHFVFDYKWNGKCWS